ncbi:5-dehydro-4-deoxy-D-glucuronate isomerase [Schnuerera sp. xch1]|uniref:5-dehydro-4-deoxy-D-glucuronate isomerase n=1 Tax=Schnuerera sp. xch1 TaxID=2874283 RepID=UPI001CBF20CB|nr:5-dehydro-4-deoxy-D-glucuronate isomerase [Schnuerera sp. xch1]MBZ2174155.1 5-dehydro-4-deoxy-D-glucuronate isomerase [Schnuerera sp. xch1]
MKTYYSTNPTDIKRYDTERLRENFLIDDLFEENKLKLVYSHEDRLIIGSACPKENQCVIDKKSLGHDSILDNRELGIINIGGSGIAVIDEQAIELGYNDGLYIGKGSNTIIFKSLNSEKPAKFYINNAPAHKKYPTVKIDASNVKPEFQGHPAQLNERKIYKYIYPTMCQSCQLVMGVTVLEPNNLWNTMPCHIHSRRTEVYLYCNMCEDHIAFHVMGEPNETRHIIVKNEQAVISPSWSIHSAVGTKRYDIIWSMVGENQDFKDVNSIKSIDLL